MNVTVTWQPCYNCRAIFFPFQSHWILACTPTFMFHRSLSILGSYNLRSFSISSEANVIKTAVKNRLAPEEALLSRHYCIASAAFSTLISLRSNVHNNSSSIGSSAYRISSTNMSSYQTEQRGSLYNDDFRLYIKDSDGKVVSAFHDIPLKWVKLTI